jgi:hypothetical protein
METARHPCSTFSRRPTPNLSTGFSHHFDLTEVDALAELYSRLGLSTYHTQVNRCGTPLNESEAIWTVSMNQRTQQTTKPTSCSALLAPAEMFSVPNKRCLRASCTSMSQSQSCISTRRIAERGKSMTWIWALAQYVRRSSGVEWLSILPNMTVRSYFIHPAVS